VYKGKRKQQSHKNVEESEKLPDADTPPSHVPAQRAVLDRMNQNRGKNSDF